MAEGLQDAPEALIESNWDEVIDSFDDMGLTPTLLRGIYAYGFERPSAIQARAIKPVIKGHDGKKGIAFRGLPMLTV